MDPKQMQVDVSAHSKTLELSLGTPDPVYGPADDGTYDCPEDQDHDVQQVIHDQILSALVGGVNGHIQAGVRPLSDALAG
jgi:hypothetical protein